MSEEHFDQLSPIQGVGQVQPDGTMRVIGMNVEQEGGGAPEMPPPGDSGTDGHKDIAQIEPSPVSAGRPDSELEEALLEVVAAQRAQLAQPAGNVDVKGAPHFERVVDGQSLCGQCAEPFPCPAYQEIAQAALDAQRSPVDAADEDVPLVTMEAAAAAAGMDLATFRNRVSSQRSGG